MGGSGSGRLWHYGAKKTTDDYRFIDVRRWKRDGLLAPHRIFRWNWLRDEKVIATVDVGTLPDSLILSYRQRQGDIGWKEEYYPILLDWTECHLGGKRPWFLCPRPGCGRRVAILYADAIFSCRHCLDLAYSSQRESDFDRAARRANKIRRQLGWTPGILNSDGGKPEGMQWPKFQRLKKKHDAHKQSAFAGILAITKKMDSSNRA